MVNADLGSGVRILDLTEAVFRNPFEGPGKREPLRYLPAGCWSRRITQECRLLYRGLGASWRSCNIKSTGMEESDCRVARFGGEKGGGSMQNIRKTGISFDCLGPVCYPDRSAFLRPTPRARQSCLCFATLLSLIHI